MEDANRAIIMAAGMLLAVMIIGTMVYMFGKMSILPQEDDVEQGVEQVRTFNQEYEVYDKKIMYGVDIISVLNKAQSNNEKYIKGNFLSGLNYNTDYAINIVVNLTKDLEEVFEVTYLDNSGDRIVEKNYTTNYGPQNVKRKDIFKTIPNTTYQNLIYSPTNNPWGVTKILKSEAIKTKITAGKYQLLSAGSIVNPEVDKITDSMLENNNSVLKQLLTQSANMSQTVKNTNGETFSKGDGNDSGWNRATWYPAIYYLKTKKFKCEGEKVTYSSKTGRIVYMEFTEIN